MEPSVWVLPGRQGVGDRWQVHGAVQREEDHRACRRGDSRSWFNRRGVPGDHLVVQALGGGASQASEPSEPEEVLGLARAQICWWGTAAGALLSDNTGRPIAPTQRCSTVASSSARTGLAR